MDCVGAIHFYMVLNHAHLIPHCAQVAPRHAGIPLHLRVGWIVCGELWSRRRHCEVRASVGVCVCVSLWFWLCRVCSFTLSTLHSDLCVVVAFGVSVFVW